MKHLSSTDNPWYRRLAAAARGRREGGQVLLEGVHLCQEWLRHQGMPLQALFDAHALSRQPELRALADALEPGLAASCEPALARKLSQVEQAQGVYFLAQAPQPQLPARINANCLWLDRVQDPGNLGTLLRTAAAAGLQEVYISAGSAGAWTPKVLRSGQGAHFALTLYERVDLNGLCERLDVELVAASLDAAAVSLYAQPLPVHCAWLFGNEGQGVDPALLQRAHRQVFIPQAPSVESLNVAAAAAICLFEQRRQAQA